MKFIITLISVILMIAGTALALENENLTELSKEAQEFCKRAEYRAHAEKRIIGMYIGAASDGTPMFKPLPIFLMHEGHVNVHGNSVIKETVNNCGFVEQLVDTDGDKKVNIIQLWIPIELVNDKIIFVPIKQEKLDNKSPEDKILEKKPQPGLNRKHYIKREI